MDLDMKETAEVIKAFINGQTCQEIAENLAYDYWDVIKIVVISGIAEVERSVWKGDSDDE